MGSSTGTLKDNGLWIHVRAPWAGAWFAFSCSASDFHSLSFLSNEAFSDEGKTLEDPETRYDHAVCEKKKGIISITIKWKVHFAWQSKEKKKRKEMTSLVQDKEGNL